MAIQPKRYNIRIFLITLLIFLLIAVGTGSFFYITSEIRNNNNEEEQKLMHIADSKAAQIEAWRKERLINANLIFKNTTLIRQIDMSWRSKERLNKDVIEWMKTIVGVGSYEDVLLLDPSCSIIAAVNYKGKELCPETQRIALEAVHGGKIAMSDLYSCSLDNKIYLDIIIPLILPEYGASNPVGVMILRINPINYLYPIIQSWPTMSKSAETLLVRKDGSDALFLNELRHRKNTALTLRIPMSSEKVHAAMAVRGVEGVVDGIDYRGVATLAVIKKIPDSSWYMISKLDRKDITDIIVKKIGITSFLGILLMLFSIVAVTLIWHKKTYDFYHAAYEDGLKRTKAEEALRRSAEEWDKTFNSISDMVFIQDKDFKIIKVNAAFAKAMNKVPAELVNRKCYELIHQRDKPWPGCPMEKTRLDNKPHTEEVDDPNIGIPLLITTSPVFDKNGEVEMIIHTAKDISEIRSTQKELKNKIEDMEKFQRISVGRELKMKELKARIAELEAKINDARQT